MLTRSVINDVVVVNPALGSTNKTAKSIYPEEHSPSHPNKI